MDTSQRLWFFPVFLSFFVVATCSGKKVNTLEPIGYEQLNNDDIREEYEKWTKNK